MDINNTRIRKHNEKERKLMPIALHLTRMQNCIMTEDEKKMIEEILILMLTLKTLIS